MSEKKEEEEGVLGSELLKININRRKALSNMGKAAIAGVAGLVIGGAGGYIAAGTQSGQTTTVTGPTVTNTVTNTKTNTATSTITTTQTNTATTTPTSTLTFPGAKVNIITWGGWLIGSLINSTDLTKQPLLKQFESETGINMSAELLDQTSAMQKYMLDLTSHTGSYDIVSTDYYTIPVYGSAGYLRPIDDLIAKYANPEYYQPTDYFMPSMDSCKWNGHTWSLPMYEHCGGFTYRKDIFDQKGLKPPTNFDELTELCKELNDPPNMYGIAMRAKSGNVGGGPISGYAWAYGGSWFEHKAATQDVIKSLKAKPAFTSPEFLAGASKYVELLKNYGPPSVDTYDWYEVFRDFCAGKVAIAMDADYGYWWSLLNAQFSDPMSKIAQAVPPRGPGGEFFQWWWSFTHCINADSKNPEAAFQVLQLLSSEQLATAMAQSGVGGVPRISIMQSDWWGQKEGKEAQRVWLANRGLAKPEFIPRFPEFNDIITNLGNAVSAAVAGTRSIQDGLSDVQAYTLNTMTKAGYYD